MKRINRSVISILLAAIILIGSIIGCTKFAPWQKGDHHDDGFDLDVSLYENGGQHGFIEFRQDKDTARVVTLDTWINGLKPNTSYLLQRAVDQTLDGDCTSTSWLTLGKGTTPQSITTDDKGNGYEQLFRNLSAFDRGTKFDIHFQIIEESTSEVVLTSSCNQFTVR